MCCLCRTPVRPTGTSNGFKQHIIKEVLQKRCAPFITSSKSRVMTRGACESIYVMQWVFIKFSPECITASSLGPSFPCIFVSSLCPTFRPPLRFLPLSFSSSSCSSFIFSPTFSPTLSPQWNTNIDNWFWNIAAELNGLPPPPASFLIQA